MPTVLCDKLSTGEEFVSDSLKLDADKNKTPRLRLLLDDADYENPKLSINMSVEYADYDSKKADADIVWTEDCSMLWVGSPDAANTRWGKNPGICTWGPHLQGKKIRLRISSSEPIKIKIVAE